MILPALISYYDRLAADPEADVAPLGFSRQKISFCVVLDGNDSRVVDQRAATTDAKGKEKLAARSLVVPGQSKPSGSGINPCFLWDNAAYMLGWKAEDENPKRTRASFEAFRDKHLALRGQIDDEAFEAVCRFLEAWDPAVFTPDPAEQEFLGSFGVFRLGDALGYVHEQPVVRAWYEESLREAEEDGGDRPLVPSLTTGRPARIARLHEPKIKGVWGGQSSGGTLVSFNNDAFESYGKSQGDNAPVGEEDAFKYCTALNRLLADPSRRTGIGDATVVWWADGPEAEEGVETISAFFDSRSIEEAANPEGSGSAEDVVRARRLGRAMERISHGEPPTDLKGSEVGFHVLGLSPNAARLSVRFWWNGTIREVIDRIVGHHRDAALEPVPPRDKNRPLTIGRMVRETARVLGDRPDMDTVSPTLVGEIARAVLAGGPYPWSLLEAIIRRVRADGRITHARASIVKACITRRRRILAGPGRQPEEVPVSLNTEGSEPYQLGRLFAALEKTQADALGDVGAGIRDRYFGSASATPASVFPRLIRLHQHHLDKMSKLTTGDLPWAKIAESRDGLIREIYSHIKKYPRHLNLEEQGIFQIGYYHQYQAFFTPKSRENQTTITEEN